MSRYLFLFFLFFTTLLSKEYPLTFSQLGTPLYKSIKPITNYADVKVLQEYILTYEQKANKAMSHGFKVDTSKDKAEIKKYLLELRDLQKSYDYLLHLLHEAINEAIDKQDYGLFLKLTSYEFDGLLKNSNLKNKAMTFYKNNKTKRRSKVLDKKIKSEKLIKKTAQELYVQSVESSFDSAQKATDTKQNVFINTKQNGKNIYVSFTNKNIYDVTLEVKPKYKNIKESKNTKRIFVLKANSTTSYTKLTIGRGAVSYRYNYSWIIGNKDAVHNDNYIYKLPYLSGTSHFVSQGFNGKFTHKGRSKYAIDFVMDKGTRVYAARAGVVVKTKSDSNKGGASKIYANDSNYVIILHNDGTFATYNHLMQHGVSVNVGDEISQGYPIGYSGSTGYSSGPHLHFAVFKAMDSSKTHTLPIRFQSINGIVSEPVVGVSYTAK